jgi:pimeloyl-ACP methyl ester carboxylesterase
MLQESIISTSSDKFIEIDGVKIRYRRAGTGDPVLLLHGWGSSIEGWASVFNDFAKQYATWAIDFPGHGESGLPPKPWGVADFKEHTLHIMDALGLKCPHIIAHSFGGRVTIKMASAHPERVNKIALVDSAGVIPPRPPKYYVRLFIAKIGKFLARYGGSLGQRIRNSIYSKIGSTDYANAGPLRDTFVKIVNEDLTPFMPQIKSSVLLVWGEDDRDTPVASARVMERLIPNSELVVLEHAGHFSYVDQPYQFLLQVKRFLRN